MAERINRQSERDLKGENNIKIGLSQKVDRGIKKRKEFTHIAIRYRETKGEKERQRRINNQRKKGKDKRV